VRILPSSGEGGDRGPRGGLKKKPRLLVRERGKGRVRLRYMINVSSSKMRDRKRSTGSGEARCDKGQSRYLRVRMA